MRIRHELHKVFDIDTKGADVERIDTYEDRISHYESKNYTFIPIISEGKYYNTEKGWLRDIEEDQFLTTDHTIKESLHKLTNYPFLIVDYCGYYHVVVEDGKLKLPPLSENYPEEKLRKPWSLWKDHPELAKKTYETKYENAYGIITLADVNKRGVKEMIYPIIAELANRLSIIIKTEHPNSESIFKHVSPETIGRWKKDRMKGLELHITEYLNLIEMKEVLKASDEEVIKKCGFSSKTQVDKQLSSVNELRKKVMHANRTLVQDREDLHKLIERLEKSEEIIENLPEN